MHTKPAHSTMHQIYIGITFYLLSLIENPPLNSPRPLSKDPPRYHGRQWNNHHLKVPNGSIGEVMSFWDEVSLLLAGSSQSVSGDNPTHIIFCMISIPPELLRELQLQPSWRKNIVTCCKFSVPVVRFLRNIWIDGNLKQRTHGFW